jgi:hypothetical protein
MFRMAESNHMKLRTLIMVVSMIALPLAAVVGFKWPQFSGTEKSKPVAATQPLERTKSSAEPAPAWNPTPAAAANPSAVISAGGSVAADNPNYPVVPVANNDVRPLDGSSATEAASGRLMLGVGVNSNAGLVTNLVQDEPADIRPLPAPTETASMGDPFTQVQQRLRALGAIHYSLETWGDSGEAYRFQCRMSAGHNYSRHFEATDVDPLRVMQTVLNDVESWKSGRLP